MKKNVAIVFPGQGSQMVGMGKDLFEKFSSAKEVFNEVDEILGYKLSQIMFNGPSDELTKTQNTQPALMAVSMALIRVLEKDFAKKFSDLCSYTAGHSLGEYSALCASNSLSLKDTAHLLQIRGQAMAKCAENTKGAMSAILGVEIDIAKQIVEEAGQGEVCQIANDNSLGQIVISGSFDAVNRANEIAKTKGAKRAILLPVSGAFHSKLMSQAQDVMHQALLKTKFSNPQVPLIANVSAQVVEDYNQIIELLTQQITGSVRWRETMLKLESLGVETVIEIGSGKVLSGLVTRTCQNLKTLSIQNSEDLDNFLKNN
ncbi:malonyl CoA-acyl carrier protein transacylase [Alphaproteobacteria bacterium]|nr:malonyl CoA-acyl carrier protein transacylase [Alphaproteobacteria bacterium]